MEYTPLRPGDFLDLTGRTALVTGAGKGIGATVAKYLAASGAYVVINDVDEERADATATEINDRTAGLARTYVADVTSYEQVAEMAASVGPIDILINNAGNAGTNAFGTMTVPFWETSPDSWSGFVDVNLTGVMNVTHALLPGMITRPHGRVVTVVSDAGRTGEARLAAYAAAKAGAAGFTRSIARAVARYGGTANCVSLGTVRTWEPDRHVRSTEEEARALDRYVIRRFGTTDDVAGVVLLLSSDAGSWITGQTIPVNGGFSFGM